MKHFVIISSTYVFADFFLELPSIHLPPSPKYCSLKTSLQQYCDKVSVGKPVYSCERTNTGFVGVVTFGSFTFKTNSDFVIIKEAENRAAYTALQHLGYISRTAEYSSFGKNWFHFVLTCNGYFELPLYQIFRKKYN